MKITKKETQASIADRFGVSVKTIQRYKADGIDITNDQAISDYIKVNSIHDHRDPSMIGMDAKDLKNRKTQADIKEKEAKAAMAEIALAKLKGSVVDMEDVIKANMKIADKVKLKLQKLILEIPPQAEGLTAIKISQLVRGKVEEILESLYEDLSIDESEND